MTVWSSKGHGTHLEPADGSTPTAPDTAAADVATSPEPMNVDAAAAAAQPAAAEVVEEVSQRFSGHVPSSHVPSSNYIADMRYLELQAMPNATEDAGGNQTGTQTASDQAMVTLHNSVA